MLARVPASSANLGPGFDALAVALELYIEVSIEPSDSFEISSEGYGAGLFDDENHMAAQIATQVLGHSNYKMHVKSGIPLSRGLGSSASLALAAASAAGSNDVLGIATKIDGHAENAAASLLGGLVVANLEKDGSIVARPLQLDNEWRFVVVIPDEELATADARRVLPKQVPFADAVHNLNSLGLLIAGLAMDDYLHQPYRMPLLPFAAPLLQALRDAGAAASCWSGAGSTMLGLSTQKNAPGIAKAANEFLQMNSIPGQVLTLNADRTGLETR